MEKETNLPKVTELVREAIWEPDVSGPIFFFFFFYFTEAATNPIQLHPINGKNNN